MGDEEFEAHGGSYQLSALSFQFSALRSRHFTIAVFVVMDRRHSQLRLYGNVFIISRFGILIRLRSGVFAGSGARCRW